MSYLSFSGVVARSVTVKHVYGTLRSSSDVQAVFKVQGMLQKI